MDIASIIGLVLCLGMMLLGIITSGGIQTIGNFIDVPSAAITFGGAFCAILASNSIATFVGGLKSFSLILKAPANNTADTINKIIELSNVARKEGLLSTVQTLTWFVESWKQSLCVSRQDTRRKLVSGTTLDPWVLLGV